MTKRDNSISDILSDIFKKSPDMASEFFRPPPEHDRLFNANYDHPGSDTCTNVKEAILSIENRGL
jgi:hypothetical protein